MERVGNCRQRPTRRGAIARLTPCEPTLSVSVMQPKAAATLATRLRRFVRWFFTAWPEAIADPRPLRRVCKPRRQDAPRLRAQHSGRVHVFDRKQS
jgi:hypothetical protein